MVTARACGGYSNQYSCPASLGGYCCQKGWICAQSGCIKPTLTSNQTATPQATSTCPGYDGYVACGEALGGESGIKSSVRMAILTIEGGCCPPGYSCDSQATAQCRAARQLAEITATIKTTISGSSMRTLTVTSTIDSTVDRVMMPTQLSAETPGSESTQSITGQQIGIIVGALLGGIAVFVAVITFRAWGILRNIREQLRQDASGNDSDSVDTLVYDEHEIDSKGFERCELGGSNHVEMSSENGVVEIQGTRLDRYELNISYEELKLLSMNPPEYHTMP